MFLKKSFLLKTYFLLVAVESTIVFYFLAAIPSYSEGVIFTGYSLGRLVLFAGAVGPFLISASALAIVSASSLQLKRFSGYIDVLLGNKRVFFCIITFSTILICFSLVFLLFPAAESMYFSAIFERLAPLIYFGGFLGAQTHLLQFYWRDQKIYFQNLKQWRFILIFTGISLVFGFIAAIWVSWTGIGIRPETYGWHAPGTPVLFSQLFLAILVFLSFVFMKRYAKNCQLPLGRGLSLSVDSKGIIFVILWLVAFLIWQNEPLRKQSYFNPKPTAPNFEYYPYSDAAFYDGTSQSILIGEGRSLQVILRPLYVFFLDVLHMVGGQNYDHIITLQVLCLAATPGLVFLLVSLLGDQSAGVMSAVIIIFRERNSIALTNILEVSHSKLLLSDLPTMLLMVLFVYVFVNWLKKSRNDYSLGLTSGAAFGLVILVRSQSQLLLPVLLVGIAFVAGFQRSKTLSRLLIFLLGLMIVVLPWVWRNYQVSGKPVVENTEFYIRLIAGGYSEPSDHVDILPGESLDEYNNRIKSQIIKYFLNHPAEIGKIYASYFIHNEISSVIYLPMSLEFYSLRSYVDHLPFWSNPHIDLSNGYGVMFFVTLGLIMLGCAVAFERLGMLGLFPLIIHFSYSFSVVIARISGWRFILPVDWIFQMYYCLGLLQIIVIIVSILWNKKLISDDSFITDDAGGNSTPSPFFQAKTSAALMFFLIIGLSLPLIELWTPVRYPPLSDDSLIQAVALNQQQLPSGELITESALKSFLEMEKGAKILYGRALYPSYYEQGVFWGDGNSALLAASRFDRLQFNLIGPWAAFVFIPFQETPNYFPHASDVFLLGCLREDSIHALIVKVNDRIMLTSPWGGLNCSALE